MVSYVIYKATQNSLITSAFAYDDVTKMVVRNQAGWQTVPHSSIILKIMYQQQNWFGCTLLKTTSIEAFMECPAFQDVNENVTSSIVRTCL